MNGLKLTKQRIKEIFDSFQQKNILIVGDVMVDSYWWGHVNRISPEAPVPIVKVNRREYRLGGAANVALNLRQMGAKPILLSIIGDDFEGHTFRDLLLKNNIENNTILKSNKRPTTLKTRIIANELQQVVRLDSEEDKPIDKEESLRLQVQFDKISDQIDAIIFQDYDKGILSESLISYITHKANKLNIPTIVDPKKRNFEHFKNVSLFKPNLKELREGLGIEINKPIEIEQLRNASKMLFDKMKVKIAFITLSEDGVYINDGKSELIVPTHKRSIFDVSGAGDTVASIAALCMSAGLSPEILANLTNIAGGLVCEKVGVVPIERNWLETETIRLLS